MMTKTKVLLAGGAAAVVLATGGVAVAATSTPSATPGTGTAGAAGAAGAKAHHRDGLGLRRIEHGQFVEKDKAGKQVTRDVVNGSVTAVSATSISVKDGSGTTTTFTVGSDTRVHLKDQAKGATSTISAVKTGTDVTVLGTGTGPYAADLVATH